MLSKEEITKGFKNAKLTISEKDLKVFMKNIDNNLNGLIKFEEFIRACSDKKKLLCDVNLKIAFDVLDEDKNGEVTKEEIRKIFFEKTKITDKALDEFLMQINKQENETILFEDFKNIMSKIR
jgi:calcium-dependent protein kinase